MKRKGISAVAMSTLAGVSASVPMLMTGSNPELVPYAGSAAAIVSLCVVLSAIISPSLAKKLHK
ncbi:2-keto-3-deoxygluconate permease [Anaerococcus sp. NML200574]|uniref:2-keto-3-deoxygluconate permease n=1 Tax=Anaerococcus sp. NML200574 TaxID=2954486 RepID=UPI00223872CA|nr:2-keto-3-deoxygluconate permease [Anaerococcus sp. NML200574]MCW6678340.1 2-keto-3-deoxygluconate permease [Anaerococcus sp. NML200574]